MSCAKARRRRSFHLLLLEHKRCSPCVPDFVHFHTSLPRAQAAPPKHTPITSTASTGAPHTSTASTSTRAPPADTPHPPTAQVALPPQLTQKLAPHRDPTVFPRSHLFFLPYHHTSTLGKARRQSLSADDVTAAATPPLRAKSEDDDPSLAM